MRVSNDIIYEMAMVGIQQGVDLTVEQIQEIIDSDEKLKEALANFGSDTGTRGMFLNATAKWLGVEGTWPLYSTPDAEALAFYARFRRAAAERGVGRGILG